MVAFEFAGVWLAIFTVVLTRCVHVAFGQYLATPDDLDRWLLTRNTTTTVEFVGTTDFSTPLGPQDVRLIYCSERIENTNTCGGTCFAYQGPGSQCMLPVLRTANCLAATRSVVMCFTRDCNDCNLYTTCGTRLDNGFCFTPQTNSIRLPVYANETSSSSSSSTLPSTSVSPLFTLTSPSSISTSTSESSSGSSQTIPVGAIVGIALGALAIILAAILFIVWIRRRQRHRDMREANLDPPPPPVPFTNTTPSAPPPRPLMAQPAPSTVSTSSSGWAPPPVKGGNFGYQTSQSTNSHSANPSFSSSDASSSLAFRQPQGPAMDIIHEDSGERIPSSIFRQSQMPAVEQPPPYTRA